VDVAGNNDSAVDAAQEDGRNKRIASNTAPQNSMTLPLDGGEARRLKKWTADAEQWAIHGWIEKREQRSNDIGLSYQNHIVHRHVKKWICKNELN
jgi:hypothetical protein